MSALWFGMALNPLSNLLKITGTRFNIRSDERPIYIINHLEYMDDLKLYVANRNQHEELIQIVFKFRKDII